MRDPSAGCFDSDSDTDSTEVDLLRIERSTKSMHG